jgi:plastocyanin
VQTVALLLTVIALLIGAPAARAADQQIMAEEGPVFSPSEVSILVGDKVTISKDVGGFHNAHYDDEAFGCPATPSTSPWSCERTFPALGKYTFHCDFHGAGMQGTVHVVSALAFGEETLVSLELAAKRIRAKGPLEVRVSNQNAFPISGELSGEAGKQPIVLGPESFSVDENSEQTVELSLPKAASHVIKRKGKLKVDLSADVTDQAANSREATATVTVKERK